MDTPQDTNTPTPNPTPIEMSQQTSTQGQVTKNIQDVKLASKTRRTFASIIDGIFIGILNDILLFFLGFVLFHPDAWAKDIVEALIFGAYVIILLPYQGRTIGEQVLGIRVINKNEYRNLTTTEAILRALVSYIPFEFLAAFFNPQQQTLHDMVSNAIVIEGR